MYLNDFLKGVSYHMDCTAISDSDAISLIVRIVHIIAAMKNSQ